MRKVNWDALSQILRRADVRWVALGSALTFFLILGLALRWRFFVAQQQLKVNFARLFRLTWIGQFFNSILPGSTGGDIVKVVQLCRVFPESRAAATATVLADRMAALVALATMCVIALLCDPTPVHGILPQRFDGRLVAGVVAALAVTSVLALLLWFRFLRQTRAGARVERTIRAARHHLKITPGLFAALLGSFVLHGLNFAIFYCFCRSLELSITYTQVLLMMPVLFLIVLLPVTVNGHGLRELLLIAYFTHFGITVRGSGASNVQEIAVAASLLAVTNDLLWSLPGGGLYFLLRRAQSTGPRA